MFDVVDDKDDVFDAADKDNGDDAEKKSVDNQEDTVNAERMSDCVQGIEPCKCKGKGHRFRRLGL